MPMNFWVALLTSISAALIGIPRQRAMLWGAACWWRLLSSCPRVEEEVALCATLSPGCKRVAMLEKSKQGSKIERDC